MDAETGGKICNLIREEVDFIELQIQKKFVNFFNFSHIRIEASAQSVEHFFKTEDIEDKETVWNDFLSHVGSVGKVIFASHVVTTNLFFSCNFLGKSRLQFTYSTK